jgi:mono/diheme cytochrome c family protein
MPVRPTRIRERLARAAPRFIRVPTCRAPLLSRRIRAFALTIALACAASPAHAQQSSTETEPRDPPPELPATLLKKQDVIATGDKIWHEQCAHCHGSKAYPGKAPKLQPQNYKPEFVWDRIHNGFRGMPPWKDVYKPDEIVGLVAYILSDEFFP